MKKSLFILMACAICFCSCKAKKVDLSQKVNVICTIFPEYDWTRSIMGDADYETTLNVTVKSGVDLHSFQPSTQDIVQISTCDLFIYVGGESDKWVKEALKNVTNKNMKVINLMEVLQDNIREEEIVEGMQAEAAEDDEEEEDEIEYDEHVWLSLKNAQICCQEIAKALCSLVPSNAQMYTDNLNAYLEKLSALDREYEQAVKNSSTSAIIFCDRFPFRYLVDDYNLKYYAAFVGCSAETEASFETVAFLANKLNELGVNTVFMLENGNDKIARTVIANAKRPRCDIISMDSMQSTTLREAFDGKNYISIMEKNLEALKKAL